MFNDFMANWQKVYSTNNPIQAEIVKSVLSENQLSPILIDKRDSAYIGFLGGECEIYVVPENVLRAIKIIQDEIKFE